MDNTFAVRFSMYYSLGVRFSMYYSLGVRFAMYYSLAARLKKAASCLVYMDKKVYLCIAFRKSSVSPWV